MSNFSLPFDESPAPRVAIDADERARRHAVDPTRNVVLEASAGTGKTRVLVERYVNLLRAGVDPANILAMTFTRKAAAEMRQRILTRLREAASQSDADRARWRALRERSGEIAISTIDAFCLSLLREFPLEADLEPGFALADETEIPRFVDQALDRALRICRGLARDQEPIALVFAQLTERNVRRGLDALLSRRLVALPAMARFLESGPRDLRAQDAIRQIRARLRATLGADDGGLDTFLECGPVDRPRYEIFRRDVRWLVAEPEADREPSPLDPGLVRAALQRVRQHFFTNLGEPRKALTPYYKKADFETEEDYRRHLALIAALAPGVRDDIRRFQRDLNVLLSRGVRQMFQIARHEYDKTLEAHAALDFSEVLDRAVRLLGQMEEFARSRYRLESRYHHVLVDEFQDTSRAQWELVSLLVKSWGEGFGLIENAPLRPSVFIVGDRKQSIYGFRDAEIAVLHEARDYIADLRPDEPARQTIARSARSVPGLLAFVNDVFAEVDQVDRRDGFAYTADDRFPPPLGPDEGDQGPDEVLGLVAGDSPEACASGVALEIERLIGSALVRDRETGLGRPAEAGDIGILFRSRESHREFEAALEARRIPSYVYKGLGFFDAVEIKDVVALLRYLANPESRASAAALLRSGFIRLSDRALQALRDNVAGALNGRQPPAMAEIGDEDRRVLTLARDATARWRALSDRLPPAELLDRIIDDTAYAFELRGPRRAQARENLKKIRAIVRRVQNRGYYTMARLAAHLDRMSAGDEANALIDAADAVTLMTVHAAKGLEFPIVFVVNLARGAGGPRAPVRVLVDDGTGEPSVSVGDFESEADEDVKARNREESKRLLYVALTRSRDRLYLSSTVKDGVWKPGTNGGLGEVLPPLVGGWLARAAAAGGDSLSWTAPSGLTHVARVCPAPAPNGPVARPEPAADSIAPAVVDRFAPLRDSDPLQRVPVTTLVARASETRGRATSSGRPDEAVATVLGRLVHLFLQFGTVRHEVGDADLARLGQVVLSAEDAVGVDDVGDTIDEAVRLYHTIRTHEAFSGLLPEACLFEVPFSFRQGNESVILRGAIDCLARTTDGRLAVLEFKTGRPSAEHRAQLDLYVSAVRAMIPGRPVEGHLVYASQS